MGTNRKLPSEVNKQRLQDAHKAFGSPKTYFFKKTTANVSREQCIKEASYMLSDFAELKASGLDSLIKNGKVIIEKIKPCTITGQI